MEIKKILVGVDFSVGSEAAVTRALGIARHVGADLCLVHVGVIPEDPAGLPESMAGTAKAYLRILEGQLARDRAALEDVRTRISGQGVEVSHVVADGFADNALVQVAADLSAELIVVGSHGRTGVKRLLLGSVAERVVRLAPCSVLVARGSGDVTGGFHRILVPTDFSPGAHQAIDTALELAASGAQVDLLHCWQLLPVTGVEHAPAEAVGDVYASIRHDLAAGIEARGRKLLEAHRHADAELRFHTLEAPPANGIHTWLDGHDYDLVVTGSHGRRGVRRFLLGSVAESVVRHASCSVLVARERGK